MLCYAEIMFHAPSAHSYQPDTIKLMTISGKPYLFLANEGDSKVGVRGTHCARRPGTLKHCLAPQGPGHVWSSSIWSSSISHPY